MNNYNNIFIAEGALKSFPYVTLDINVNNILNHCTNYAIRECCKKTNSKKWNYLSKCIWFITCHEIAVSYVFHLETQLSCLRYFCQP